jgi:glycosyltransferase involved in cell wall biosynthesis
VTLLGIQPVARNGVTSLQPEVTQADRVAVDPGSGIPGGPRILLVAPQPFYQDRGTPIAVRQVLGALSQLGYAADLLTYPVGSDIRLPGLRVFRTANPFGVKHVPVGLSIQKILLDFPLTLDLNGRLRHGAYSCIHAVEEAAFPAVVLGRYYRVPVVYDMQSSLPEQLVTLRGFGNAPARYLMALMERWLLSRADFVVSSAGLAGRVRQLAPKAKVREWHYPSVIVPAGQSEVERLRRELRIPQGAPVVLYGGTFESYQGLSELIDAVPRVLAQLPNVKFVLVGAENGTGSAVRAQAARLIETGAVRIVDRQPRHEIPSYLSLADILVSPRSHGGNLPLKVFDYLAAGRAIVATDIPTHRTVLNEERAVLVPPRSMDLASGILSLLRDPARAQRLAEAGRRYAEQHLGWTRFVEGLADLYQEVHQHAARS